MKTSTKILEKLVYFILFFFVGCLYLNLEGVEINGMKFISISCLYLNLEGVAISGMKLILILNS